MSEPSNKSMGLLKVIFTWKDFQIPVSTSTHQFTSYSMYTLLEVEESVRYNQTIWNALFESTV